MPPRHTPGELQFFFFLGGLFPTLGRAERDNPPPPPPIDLKQYVAQYPDGTSIRTLKTKTQFLRRPSQFSVNEVFQMKAEHFSFKMKVLTILKLAKQS